MERTGGEPDVLNYDYKALISRKKNIPKSNALDMANDMGIELLTQSQYHILQNVGNFDTKTSSLIMTPSSIKIFGGALFCNKRYDHIFVYHNGTDSYYSSIGFRGLLKL